MIVPTPCYICATSGADHGDDCGSAGLGAAHLGGDWQECFGGSAAGHRCVRAVKASDAFAGTACLTRLEHLTCSTGSSASVPATALKHWCLQHVVFVIRPSIYLHQLVLQFEDQSHERLAWPSVDCEIYAVRLTRLPFQPSRSGRSFGGGHAFEDLRHLMRHHGSGDGSEPVFTVPKRETCSNPPALRGPVGGCPTALTGW